MGHVRSYATFEEMQADLARNEDEANRRVMPGQRRVVWGSHWMRVVSYPGEHLLIAGRVMTREEVEADERRLGSKGRELKSSMADLDGMYARGYRFGRAYSVVEPDGELGHTHIGQMIPISEEEFEQLRLIDWNSTVFAALIQHGFPEWRWADRNNVMARLREPAQEVR